MRAYINALSYGQATLDVRQFPHAFSNGPGVVEAAWQSLPSGHGCPYVLCVIPWADGNIDRNGWFTGVGQNGVEAVSRVAVYDYLPTKTRQRTGVWAMEVLHAMVGWPDLYKANGTLMYDWDNMTYNAGTHSCAHLKLRPGWLAQTDVADHNGPDRDYDIQSLATMPPPPGRVAAVRIHSTLTGNTFMAEARLKSDVYERGFAQLIPTPGTPPGPNLEFRGLPGEGVIVYQVHDDLQETYFKGGPLDTGQSYQNPDEGFSVQVLQRIDAGMRVHVTLSDPRPTVPNVLEMAPTLAAKKVHDAGFVASFTGQSTGPRYVATQNPAGGQKALAGATVTMFLKKGPVP